MTLTIEHVTREFVSNVGEKITALDDINLVIGDQEFICFLGPSGCGKTTLLRIIAGLDQATSGRAIHDDHEIREPDPKMAMIFQEYSLYPWRNVLENVVFGLELRGIPKDARISEAERYLDLVGLEGFSRSYPYELSGGMRQRVAVARALAVEPSVLLMDEPFGALDAQTRNMMQKELLRIWDKTKKSIVFVTHSVDEAVYMADRIVVFTPRPGRLKEIIRISLPRPRDRTSAEFASIRRYVLDLIDEKENPSKI